MTGVSLINNNSPPTSIEDLIPVFVSMWDVLLSHGPGVKEACARPTHDTGGICILLTVAGFDLHNETRSSPLQIRVFDHVSI
jgi:hypothetical protein